MNAIVNWIAAAVLGLALAMGFHLDGPDDTAAAQAQADWMADAQRMAVEAKREAEREAKLKQLLAQR
ncbi:MAG: hypothetical protein RL758_1804 [Pseudomonadota bacterium]|jgi:hypothetical protein